MRKLLLTASAAFGLVFGLAVPALAGNVDPGPPSSATTATSESFNQDATEGTTTEQLATAGCLSGWTDSTVATRTVIYVDTFGTQRAKEVDRVQYHFPTCGDTNLYHVDAVRAACSIRALSQVSGVKVTDCALGLDGGATLTHNGPFLDGGTCCANGASPFRYAYYDPNTDNKGFRARCTCAFRSSTTGILYTYNQLTSSTSHNWIFGFAS
jgi:hypothetical protein